MIRFAGVLAGVLLWGVAWGQETWRDRFQFNAGGAAVVSLGAGKGSLELVVTTVFPPTANPNQTHPNHPYWLDRDNNEGGLGRFSASGGGTQLPEAWHVRLRKKEGGGWEVSTGRLWTVVKPLNRQGMWDDPFYYDTWQGVVRDWPNYVDEDVLHFFQHWWWDEEYNPAMTRLGVEDWCVVPDMELSVGLFFSGYLSDEAGVRALWDEFNAVVEASGVRYVPWTLFQQFGAMTQEERAAFAGSFCPCDRDGDGWADVFEERFGYSYLVYWDRPTDRDGDGELDPHDVDIDGDGVPNGVDNDDDGDGITDENEQKNLKRAYSAWDGPFTLITPEGLVIDWRGREEYVGPHGSTWDDSNHTPVPGEPAWWVDRTRCLEMPTPQELRDEVKTGHSEEWVAELGFTYGGYPVLPSEYRGWDYTDTDPAPGYGLWEGDSWSGDGTGGGGAAIPEGQLEEEVGAALRDWAGEAGEPEMDVSWPGAMLPSMGHSLEGQRGLLRNRTGVSDVLSLVLGPTQQYCVVFAIPWVGGGARQFEVCALPDVSKPAGAALDVVRVCIRAFLAVLFCWRFVVAMIELMRSW